ncbi:MAG: nicotinate-nucleotide adenylyltransferase [Candidatus Cloacimonetes bacterium]|nr:nicotinate-nucleotide adenylyltransferase [Candidatus Cloacimonadota bacterium]
MDKIRGYSMKIGILGGTFNPIHNGHLAAAQAVYEQLALDKVLLVPSYHPPHKGTEKIIPYEERWHLLELAAKPFDFIELSNLDYTPNEKSYTKNLMLRLLKKYPSSSFFFIIGADNIAQIATWYEFEWLLDNVTFVAVTREGFNKNSLSGVAYLDKIIFVEMTPIDVSSSMIRHKLSNNEDISPFVPQPVADYITQHNLYKF